MKISREWFKSIEPKSRSKSTMVVQHWTGWKRITKRIPWIVSRGNQLLVSFCKKLQRQLCVLRDLQCSDISWHLNYIRGNSDLYDEYNQWHSAPKETKARNFLKALRHKWRILKKLAQFFQVRRLQSVSIFLSLNRPCSFLVYFYLFNVFSTLETYFMVFFSLKMIL